MNSMIKSRLATVIIISLIFFNTAISQQVIDRVVAIVDKEIITEAELGFRVLQYSMQNKVDPDNVQLRKQILDQLIADKLILAQAVEDSITVTDDEISRQVDESMKRFVLNYGSEQKIEEMYGMSMSKIKREIRDDVKKQLLSQKLQQKKFGELTASPRDVEDFVTQYSDSLPIIPRQYVLSQIFIAANPSDTTKAHVKLLAMNLLDSLKHGADFQEMAKKYSQDGSAKFGGDLGWAKRGSFVKEFEEVAFSMTDGSISKVVETQFGFHIIQLVERKGESIHTRHILFKVDRTDSDNERARKRLLELRDRVLKGESFADLAKSSSEDPDTKPFGGDLGPVLLDQLNPAIKTGVENLKPGEMSNPLPLTLTPTTSGYALMFVREIIPEHKMNIQQDYKRLEQQTLLIKQTHLMERWIEELKKNIFWENRL